MSFRQYTQCYNHTVGSGDKPFNESDLFSFALGTSAPGLIAAIVAFLLGANLIGFIAIAIQYAVTITAIANQWLYHRLVCLGGNVCAVGAIDKPPETDTLLGAFDNDNFFDMRLMPHRYDDAYRTANAQDVSATPVVLGFFADVSNAGVPTGSPPSWKLSIPPRTGPSLDGNTEIFPENDIFLDKFQGTKLLRPTITDLPYTPVDWKTETALKPPGTHELPRAANVTRATLHCEAEGNFWQAMKDTAGLQGLAVGLGAAGGATAGAAAGCAIGGIFGPIGCLIGAIIGFILGLAAGGAAGALAAASAAFNSDPGDVNDANVGDTPLGELGDNDKVIVYGTHVYDGFHTGWHEIHPLMAIMRCPPPETYTNVGNLAVEGITFNPPYLEWGPNGLPGPGEYEMWGLATVDMLAGLNSVPFTALANKIQQQWCGLLSQAFDGTTQTEQQQPKNRWTIHALVDGCEPVAPPPPPPLK